MDTTEKASPSLERVNDIFDVEIVKIFWENATYERDEERNEKTINRGLCDVSRSI